MVEENIGWYRLRSTAGTPQKAGTPKKEKRGIYIHGNFREIGVYSLKKNLNFQIFASPGGLLTSEPAAAALETTKIPRLHGGDMQHDDNSSKNWGFDPGSWQM